MVLNTRSFIGPAREESHQAIADLVARKKAGDLGAVVVAGCLVQRYKRGLARQYPEVDAFAEISDYRALAKTIKGIADGDASHAAYSGAGPARACTRRRARLATPGSYAYLRISHGCDHTQLLRDPVHSRAAPLQATGRGLRVLRGSSAPA